MKNTIAADSFKDAFPPWFVAKYCCRKKIPLPQAEPILSHGGRGRGTAGILTFTAVPVD